MNTAIRSLFCICLLVVLATGSVKAVEKKKGAPPTTSSTVRGHRLLLGGTELRHVYLLGVRVASGVWRVVASGVRARVGSERT